MKPVIYDHPMVMQNVVLTDRWSSIGGEKCFVEVCHISIYFQQTQNNKSKKKETVQMVIMNHFTAEYGNIKRNSPHWSSVGQTKKHTGTDNMWYEPYYQLSKWMFNLHHYVKSILNFIVNRCLLYVCNRLKLSLHLPVVCTTLDRCRVFLLSQRCTLRKSWCRGNVLVMSVLICVLSLCSGNHILIVPGSYGVMTKQNHVQYPKCAPINNVVCMWCSMA